MGISRSQRLNIGGPVSQDKQSSGAHCTSVTPTAPIPWFLQVGSAPKIQTFQLPSNVASRKHVDSRPHLIPRRDPFSLRTGPERDATAHGRRHTADCCCRRAGSFPGGVPLCLIQPFTNQHHHRRPPLPSIHGCLIASFSSSPQIPNRNMGAIRHCQVSPASPLSATASWPKPANTAGLLPLRLPVEASSFANEPRADVSELQKS